MVTCPRPPAFARPNKYSSCLSLHRQGLLSWVTVTYFTPPGGGTTAGSNAPGAFLVTCAQRLCRGREQSQPSHNYTMAFGFSIWFCEMVAQVIMNQSQRQVKQTQNKRELLSKLIEHTAIRNILGRIFLTLTIKTGVGGNILMIFIKVQWCRVLRPPLLVRPLMAHATISFLNPVTPLILEYVVTRWWPQ